MPPLLCSETTILIVDSAPPSQIGSHYVNEVSLKLAKIPLPLSPKCLELKSCVSLHCTEQNLKKKKGLKDKLQLFPGIRRNRKMKKFK